jgi:pyruvyltransferase
VYKAWWASSTPNFGDLLTPYILNYFSIPWTRANDIHSFNLISVGSIAKLAKPGTIVLGSGIMGSNEDLCSDSIWMFVRGPYTRNRIVECGGTCPEIYGDPAMLLPLLCDESKKEYDVGIVPHYVDQEIVKEKYPNYNIIDVKNLNPLETATEITKCRSIISSSLHGIICAHAYNIPAAWVPFSNKVKGDGVKFKDHYSSIDLDCVSSTIENPIFTVGNFKNFNKIKKIYESICYITK